MQTSNMYIEVENSCKRHARMSRWVTHATSCNSCKYLKVCNSCNLVQFNKRHTHTYLEVDNSYNLVQFMQTMQRIMTRHKRRKEKQEKLRMRRKSRDSTTSSETQESAKNIIETILQTFPSVAAELKQLLQMVDDGQAVDISGISDRALFKQLKKLFASLRLKSSETGVYLLPSKAHPTLELVGPVILTYLASQEQQVVNGVAQNHEQSTPSNAQFGKTMNEPDEGKSVESSVNDDLSAPRRRLIGPEMPSSALLAAAAKLTEAEAALREAEVETDADLFIGPPPPAIVAEAESTNEAERFDEITRILGVEIENSYDVLGVNWKMSSDNIKKRYWKLSLMVHPDKCSHPQAHQAFVALNKAFKDIEDPDKARIKMGGFEEQEEMKVVKAELRAMREAAQWRKLQGISMEGDEELLAEPELPPKREEWMTTLPPERKVRASLILVNNLNYRGGKEGRGDTSSWTDTPLEKAQKAKMNYLEAYNEAAALADSAEKKRTNSDAALVDQYSSVKRSKTLMQKHHEERSSKRKAKKEEKKKGEWEGQHPWKPWDREKDLTAGRQKVNLDSESMVQGLSSRFSSGNIQRNFL
ncbi:hypothetical protein Scep_025142 [Stephania cephalantha]|uniref:J domain-containing protein n=1 Tax=Stephania cephalantha TaxID=152367 RepID=A0AAP0HM18_9MAGN